MSKKIIALVLALLMATLCFALAGCKKDKNDGDSDLAYIKGKGKLIVGITDFEPMDYQEKDSTEWTGFDAELARAVAEKLGVSVEFKEISWKMKETELSSKNIDCIWNGLTWDEERAENMSLSDYYMLNRQVLVVKADNAETLNTLDALMSAKLTAEEGSAGEEFINENLTDATYTAADAQIDALKEVLAGTSDACIIDYTMAYYLINKEGSDFSGLTILEGVVNTEDEYYSVAFRKGSDATAEVNSILAALKKDGTVNTIAAKYNLQDAIVK